MKNALMSLLLILSIVAVSAAVYDLVVNNKVEVMQIKDSENIIIKKEVYDILINNSKELHNIKTAIIESNKPGLVTRTYEATKSGVSTTFTYISSWF